MKSVHNSRLMTRSAILRRAGAGFSLVELSVVTLIIGILLTLGLSAMNAVRENTALSASNAKQAALKDALIGYLRRNSRLPCPDTNTAAPDGLENRTPAGVTNPCTSNFGLLPYVTLGIARDAAQDGWGNFFSFHVSDTLGSNLDWVRTANFRTGNTGILTVNDRNGAVVTAIATSVVAVVVSHGPNGFGAWSIGGTQNAAPAGADEIENTNSVANTTYFRRNATTDDAAIGGAFDDAVMFLTADDLLSPLYKDGTLKPAVAAVNDSFTKFKLALVGYAMGSSSIYGNSTCNGLGATPKCRLLPYADVTGGNGWQNAGTTAADLPYLDLGLTLADGTDPWGVRYRMTVNATVASTAIGGGISSASPAAATTAITLTSNGPDRAAGSADDISLAVSVAEIRGYMSSLLP